MIGFTGELSERRIYMSGTQSRSSVPLSAWGAPIVSVLVLVTFGIVVALAMLRALPDSQGMTMLLGAVVSLATTVVGYWCGSSASSQKKDDTIANAQTALANSQPVASPKPVP